MTFSSTLPTSSSPKFGAVVRINTRGRTRETVFQTSRLAHSWANREPGSFVLQIEDKKLAAEWERNSVAEIILNLHNPEYARAFVAAAEENIGYRGDSITLEPDQTICIG